MITKKIIDIPIEESEFTVLDFETTGTAARNARVIEVGLVKVKNLKVKDTYSTLIDPETDIPFFITELTGITNALVSGAPTFVQVARELEDFIGDSVLTAHNLPFDLSFLKSEFRRAEIPLEERPMLCTLKLARRLYPQLPSKSLTAMTKHFRLRNKKAHRALGDAMVTAKILIKMIDHLKDEYHCTTLSDVISFQGIIPNTGFRILKKKLAEDFQSVPDEPGIYFFKDKNEKIIYIGKAKSLKKRVNSYFVSYAPSKAKKIVRKASRLGFQTTNTELTALLAEAILIKHHNPELNLQLKKYPVQLFIKSTVESRAPMIIPSSNFDFDGNDYFGPYPNRETVSALVEIVQRTFKLRECSEKEFVKGKKCYLSDIERCLEPCTSASTKEEYMTELDRAYDFLCGNNQDAVNRLLNKMKLFSAEQKYEEAANIRDTVNLILSQLNRASILAEPINKAKVLLEISDQERKDYLLLLEGKLFVKDFFADKNLFDSALTDYFEKNVQVFNEVAQKDLEQIKIALSWMVKNRNKVTAYYLKDYESIEELYSHSSFPKIRFKRTKSPAN
ncbi:MAG: exonuclease domain-containing protein [Melioribacteraceae bacterium]|nr:exonuclease domain-containing protein [Melioribacteraceae bacterium]